MHTFIKKSHKDFFLNAFMFFIQIKLLNLYMDIHIVTIYEEVLKCETDLVIFREQFVENCLFK